MIGGLVFLQTPFFTTLFERTPALLIYGFEQFPGSIVCLSLLANRYRCGYQWYFFLTLHDCPTDNCHYNDGD